MSRQYSQQDLQQAQQAEAILRTKGLIVDPEDNEDAADKNAAWLTAYFDQNPHITMTVPAILKACEEMKDKLVWKSKPQMDYEAAYNGLTQNEKDTFGSWWYRQKSVLILDGDLGFANATKVILWMKGRTFSNDTLNLALSNVAAAQGLHWAATPRRVNPRSHASKDDGKGFMPKSETNLTAGEQARKRATPDSKPVASPQTDYKKLAESVTTGRTHSDSARLQTIFVMRQDAPTEIDWTATYRTRQQFADGKK